MNDDQRFLQRVDEIEAELARVRDKPIPPSILGHQLRSLFGIGVIAAPPTTAFIWTLNWVGASAVSCAVFGWLAGTLFVALAAFWRRVLSDART